MQARLSKALKNVVPFFEYQSQDRYVEDYLRAANVKAASDLERKARRISANKAKALLEHAVRYEGAEQDRGNSITARAQALLVAQTFFGVLLAIATALVGRPDSFTGWLFVLAVTLLGYTLILIVLLTVYALRATAGLRYRRTSTPDILRWMPHSEPQLLGNLATSSLANYRHAAIVNTWRSEHLTMAQTCLRNIVFALAGLVVVAFLAVVQTGPRFETADKADTRRPPAVQPEERALPAKNLPAGKLNLPPAPKQ